jgi:deoxycytidylate deaminase
MKRPSLDEYFLKLAAVVAERSTCIRRHVGAVAVRDKHILATGYNGAPAGAADCLELGSSGTKIIFPAASVMKFAGQYMPSRM